MCHFLWWPRIYTDPPKPPETRTGYHFDPENKNKRYIAMNLDYINATLLEHEQMAALDILQHIKTRTWSVLIC